MNRGAFLCDRIFKNNYRTAADVGENMTDNDYMKRAIELAVRARGFTSPNPMVGAVIVKDGRIIGEGYHHMYGDLHAERDALKNCTEDAHGATIYVTLEPCCHHGKQPPCTDAIIEAGISKVVLGSGDPNPLVAGKGLRILRDNGIEVVEHVLEKECLAINDIFFHYIQTNRPYILMKYAMTMDGKIAAYTGKSQWITSEAAREYVHAQRHNYRGIMVGVQTVLEDDPMLTCRLEGKRNPIRIICDSQLRTPLDCKIVKSAKDVDTIIATCLEDNDKIKAYESMGVTVIVVKKNKDGKVSLPELMDELGKRKIDSIMVEGGATLNWSLLEAGLVNKVQAYIAPKLLGGATAKSPVAGLGFENPDLAVKLINSQIISLGEDFLIESEVAGCSQE